jgi:16S rRNA (uracil1498-N3)-methyltransferase
MAARPKHVRLTRLFHAAPLVAGATVRLEARAAAHLARVLRMQVGDALRLFDGRGAEHAASIIALKAERVDVELGAALAPLPESPLAITLAQGISRGERMDYAIQKATELGVARIVPLTCERSVVRLRPDQAVQRHEHWRGVVISACEQCGRATLPALEAPRRLDAHLALARDDRGPTLRAVLAPGAADGPRRLPAGLAAIELLIGPEGGLSDAEIRLAVGAGYRSLSLGPRVLRTETAAAAAIAALQTLYGDLG